MFLQQCCMEKELYKVMEGADKDGVIQLNGRKMPTTQQDIFTSQKQSEEV